MPNIDQFKELLNIAEKECLSCISAPTAAEKAATAASKDQMLIENPFKHTTFDQE